MTDKQKTEQIKGTSGHKPSTSRSGLAQDGYSPKASSESKPVAPPPKKP